MTNKIELTTNEYPLSRWQKLRSWINSLALAMDYDPAYDDMKRLRDLNDEVLQIRQRVLELERCEEEKSRAPSGPSLVSVAE